MSDETNGINGSSNGHQENDSTAPEIRVLGQYIKDLSFESPNAPESLKGPGDQPNLALDINVGVNNIDTDTYESAIEFKGNATNADGTIYIIEVVYAGIFQVRNMPKEQLKPILLVNCPALLYPFLRRIIADLTHEGGFPPLLLDPIDFAGLYHQRQQEENPSA